MIIAYYVAQINPGLHCKDSRFIFEGVKLIQNKALYVPTISDQVSCSVECQKTTNCLASLLFGILDLSQVCWVHKGVVEGRYDFLGY